MEDKKKNSLLVKILLVIISCFVGACGMYLVIHFFPSEFVKFEKINTTKLVKDVSITDTGIAEAVDKIYDAVVVVETYKSGVLIGSGTGFVYKTKDNIGYILTNNHVISSGNKIYVTFTSGKRLEAEVLGSDAYTDIAVLSINAFKDMKIASIGNTKDAKVGDTVFAVGAPLDNTYSWTVTRGILSGKDRMIEVDSTKTNSQINDWIMVAIQTDAAINSGNSGGPLCNANGEVIGITSLKLVSNGVEGMGFAIPMEIATKYGEKIINGEKIRRPYLGIAMQNVSQISPNLYDSDKTTTGVYVEEVENGSSADKAGIRKGDIITEINGETVKNLAYLKYNLYKYQAGDKITISILRGDDMKKVEVTLGENSN